MRAGVYGPTVERIALAERVAELRAQGLVQRAIAERLGISRSYTSALLVDPNGSKDRARKDSYAGEAAGYDRPDRGHWERCGERGVGAAARLVLDSLRDADEPLGPQAIGRPVGLTRFQVGQALTGLLARGLVEKVAHGKYAALKGDAMSPTGRAEA